MTICLVASPLAAAETVICDDPLFRVSAGDPATAERTCRSAAAARESLRSCGIAVDTPLEISVVETLDGVLGDCLGVYHCGENLIEILSPEAMPAAREAGGAFDGISDDAFWDSVLVHELTHAVYDRIKCPFSSCVATSEFASYAMQVRSLPPEERELFGESVALKSEPNSGAISAMMYFMAPDRFAKYAWLHFSSRPDPCGYMDLIMNGDIFFDMEPL